MNGWTASALLPGAYFLLLGSGLAAILGRWYGALPRWTVALFLALPALLFAPALFGGRVLLPVALLHSAVPFQQLAADPAGTVMGLQRDLVRQIAPWTLEVKRALAGGGWPLWNRLEGAGMPLMADPQSQPFQPLVMAAYPFPVWQAAGITAALRVYVALAFTFLLLRRQGMDEPAALCGSLGFGLGSFLLLWLGWPIANCAALLPAGLYAVALCDVRGARRDSALLAGVLAALLLAGHPETMLYALALIALFALCRAAALAGDARWRLLGRTAVALGVAAGLAAPPLLLARAYLPTTVRAEAVRSQLAQRPLGSLWSELLRPESLAGWSRRSVSRLLLTAAPRALGDEHFHYWGDTDYIEDAAGFAGTATLLAAALGLAGGARRRRLPQERLMRWVLLGSLLLLAQPPGLENLAVRVPIAGIAAVHHAGRIQLLVGFCLAYLAACEVDRWTRTTAPDGVARSAAATRLAVVPLRAATLVVLAVLAWGYLGHMEPGHSFRQDSHHLRWLWLQAAVLAAAASLLPLSIFRSSAIAKPARRRLAAWVFCSLVGGELLYLNAAGNPSGPARLAYPVTPPVAFLMQNLGNDRMVGIGRSFPANYPAVYGLDDVRIDNPSLPDGYQRVIAGLDSGGAAEPMFGRPAHPFYDFLGVRYVITRPGIELPLPLVLGDPAGWVYERQRPLPRLFLPERVRADGGQWGDWLEANDDFGRRALASPGGELLERRWRAERPRQSSLLVEAVESSRVSGQAALVERRLLAASIYQDGGWHLMAGGVRQPGVLVDGVFAGGWLPAGNWHVELIYRPPLFVAGCLLTALALAIGVACWAPAPVLS